jgi:hypothetical protein
MPEPVADFLGDVTVLQAVIWIAIAVTLIVGLVKLWPIVRKAVKLTDSLATLPDFIERTDKAIAEIHHEVHYNNGSSVKDAQRRTEQAVERIELGVKGLYEKVDDLTAEDKRLQTQIDENTQPHPRSGVPQPRRKK